MSLWANVAAGFGVGAVVGGTGVGGGSLMAPILVILFGIAPVSAIGTDLWFAAATKIVGGFVHHQRGGVDKGVLMLLSCGSLPTAIATLLWMRFGNGAQVQSGIVITALGVVLLLTAGAMVFKRQAQAFGQRLRTSAPADFKRAQPALTVVAGAILGILVTLTSIGAGALGTVMLVYLYPFRLTPARLVGTDIVHAIPLTIVAGTGHLLMGNVDLPLLGSLLLGSIPGVVLGSILAGRLPEKIVRMAMACALTVAGLRLLR
jgi:uncharacterized protein